MGKTAEGCFDAADDNGNMGIAPADEIAVDGGGIVRAQAHFAPGGEIVIAPAAFCHGIVVHHGVHIAAHHQKAQARGAQKLDAVRVLPVRLGDDAHLKPMGLQNPADDGMAKGGVVYIGVADDIDKIALFPAPGVHIGPRDGKKALHNAAPLS